MIAVLSEFFWPFLRAV